MIYLSRSGISFLRLRWCFTGVGADGAGSSLPPSLFVPTWGIHLESRSDLSSECLDLLDNLIPPGVSRGDESLGQ
ncbi:hypothetical protein Tco_0568640 [Tanacetum coccineum]